MLKRFIKYIIKVVISGVLAWLCLTLFCTLYYNVPAHSENASGATDHAWEPHVFYSRATEGFAYGTTNNEGFNNMYDYTEETSVDVLVMGSSHMEAFQVGMSESTAGRLDALLEDETVYNIGVSSHGFQVCIANLENAILKYDPKKHIIIETYEVEFSDEVLTKALTGNIEEIPSGADNKLLVLLQKNQYLRLAYKQLREFLNDRINDVDLSSESIAQSEKDDELLFDFIEKIGLSIREWSDKGRQLIIVYHPRVTILEDGELRLEKNELAVRKFAEACEKNGILFLDMSDRFLAEYTKNYILPYGFSNSSVGSGHLNKYGHEMMAEELYKLIKGAE